MESFYEYMNEYRTQLEKGEIQKAYKGLMGYIMDLRAYFKNKYPDYFVSGSIYYGYMDMTYFALIPKSFKNRNLKIAIIFNHEAFRFEAWLAGYNKQVQAKFWKLFKESTWNKFPVVNSTKGVVSIIETILVENPDFSDLEPLTKQIESETLEFIAYVENFLSEHDKLLCV